MTIFDRVLEETDEVVQKAVYRHPFIAKIFEGDITKDQYASYLTETFHMVKHTPRMLALAATRFDESRRKLQHWFIEQADEESNHDLFCVNDLKNLGYNPELVLARQPLRGSWGLITQDYYMCTYGYAAGILGVASLSEGLGSSIALDVAEALNKKCGIPTKSVTFIKSHGGFDVEHYQECIDAINEMLSGEEEIQAVIQARKMTALSYGQLFTDALEQPVVAGQSNKKSAAAA